MKKHLFIAITALAVTLGLLFGPGARADGSMDGAQATVKAFYGWYIELNAKLTYPLLDKKIFDYVATDTVYRLRSDYAHNRLPGHADYFLKVQDQDDQDWLAHIATLPPVPLGDVAVVPVTFGSADKVSVLVFVKKVNGLWKITKVDDTADYK